MDVAEEKDEERHLAWYAKVLTRWVDLVGDYAGNELFLIEGESLLLHCFSISKVDLDDTSNIVASQDPIINSESFTSSIKLCSDVKQNCIMSSNTFPSLKKRLYDFLLKADTNVLEQMDSRCSTQYTL